MPETTSPEILNMVPDTDLKNILEFVLETGKLKSVIRQTYMPDQKRHENAAEHSWHLTIMALLLKEYAPSKINMEKTLKMLIVHDLGEIYAGDIFFYDKKNEQCDKEQKALEDMYQDLPNHIQEELLSLWKEFENGETPESQYAQALDRFNPFLYQLQNNGELWKRNKIEHETALARNSHIEKGSEALWSAYKTLAEAANSQNLFYKKEQKNA